MIAMTGAVPAAEVDTAPMPVAVERAFPALSFRRPLLLTYAPDGTDRVFVASQYGKVHVFPNDPEVNESKVFLDIEDRVTYKDAENEEGFLGLAFHPKYRENGEFYVYYTTRTAPHTSVISRFRVSKDDPDRADPESEEEILRIAEPYWNHNGGTLAFGPDSYLYIGLGDGGAAHDPWGNGQNRGTLLGSILRIDVDQQDPGLAYAVPPDNPFVDATPAGGREKSVRPEIWAYGLRNVWRLAFDRETGTLWAADVGQDLWEEINLIRRGGNYGWNLREGMHSFGPNGSGPRDDLIEPIWEYSHDVGRSVTGGHVYHGKRVPELVGWYLYADYVTGQLWALKYDVEEQRVVANRPISGNTMPVMSFGEDQQGEVYFMTDHGAVHRFRSGE